MVIDSLRKSILIFLFFFAGYGADAICPYLAFELAFSLRNDNIIDQNLTDDDIYKAYQNAIETGLAKVMAKMGISTLQSYKSAQIFEAVGLSEEVIDKCFRGTQSRIGKYRFYTSVVRSKRTEFLFYVYIGVFTCVNSKHLFIIVLKIWLDLYDSCH